MTIIPHQNQINCFVSCEASKIDSGLCHCSNRTQDQALNQSSVVERKEKKMTIYANGFEIRKHNLRITFVEDYDKHELTFKRYVGGNQLTAIANNIRGIATTSININKDTFEEILSSYIKYKQHND